MLNWQRETENNWGRNESESEEDRVKVKGQKKRFFFSRVKGGNAEILYVNWMEERLSESEDRGRKKLLLFFFPDFENIAHIFSRGPALKHLFCNYSVGYVHVYVCLMPWKRKAKTVTRSIVRWGCTNIRITGDIRGLFASITFHTVSEPQNISSCIICVNKQAVFSCFLCSVVDVCYLTKGIFLWRKHASGWCQFSATQHSHLTQVLLKKSHGRVADFVPSCLGPLRAGFDKSKKTCNSVRHALQNA